MTSKLIVARSLKMYNTHKYTTNENVTNVNMRSGLFCSAQCSVDGIYIYLMWAYIREVVRLRATVSVCECVWPRFTLILVKGLWICTGISVKTLVYTSWYSYAWWPYCVFYKMFYVVLRESEGESARRVKVYSLIFICKHACINFVCFI